MGMQLPTKLQMELEQVRLLAKLEHNRARMLAELVQLASWRTEMLLKVGCCIHCLDHLLGGSFNCHSYLP